MKQIFHFLMLSLLPSLLLPAATQAQVEQPQQAREPYVVQYVKDAPYGVMDWVRSERIKQGIGTESGFVPYNSEAAQNLWLDATTVRNVESSAVPVAGRKTSFNMVYSDKGWHVFIQCDEPDFQNFLDQGKDIKLELFFVPGLERTHYYQLMIHQLPRRVDHHDWGTASRDFRTLKDRITVESMPLDTGFGTFLFVPWDAVYDRVPYDGDTWRFSFMRWGGDAVTWGGKVHDTGNFGLVKFEKPSPEVADTIRRANLRKAWATFQQTATKTAERLNDEVMGDPAFVANVLQPVIDRYKATGQELGAPDKWTDAAMRDSATLTKNFMEFQYEIQSLRAQYLLDGMLKTAK